MRHYLILFIQFVLFPAEICEPEIKENLISEALVLTVSEPKYFPHIAAASGGRDILSASNEVHKAAWKAPGHPCFIQFTNSPKLPFLPSQHCHRNVGISESPRTALV